MSGSNDYFDILNYFLSASNVMLKREAKNIVHRSGKKILLLIENLKKKIYTYNNHIKIFNLKSDLYEIERKRYERGMGEE